MKSEDIKNVIVRLDNINDEYKVPLSDKSLYKIAQLLSNPNLPKDFIELNKICRCDFFKLFQFLNFDHGVVEETLAWRESVNFPKNCVALSEEGESAIIMRITGDNAEVIWCSIPDLYNLCEEKPLEDNPTIFPTFTDFYSYLLDEEEKIRKENQQ